METQPVYCGLIDIQLNMGLFMCCSDQTDTDGCETREMHFNNVKDVYNIYN